MFDFIPVIYYTPIYYILMLLVVLRTFLFTQYNKLNTSRAFVFQRNLGLFIFIFTLLYMGLRPISGVFVDMTTYNKIFERYASGGQYDRSGDLLFHVFTKISSGIMTANFYFFICSVLYVVPLYMVCKKWFSKNWVYAFLLLITAFTFWNYGTNGIRNGMAGSIFLLAISRDKKVYQLLLIITAVSFHQSMILPAVAFLVSSFINKPKIMIAIWFVSILLSLVAGGLFEVFFAGLGFDDDRVSYLTDKVVEGRFSSTGFRWDFLLYSATAIFAGWYFIVKKKYYDKTYFILFNTYLISNAFWILVIRANFSNRFAYLSWFMMSLVVIYPLLKSKLFATQLQLIGIIVLTYFSFTFLMNFLLLL
ncbi:EpsG family protein [Polaribacter sp. IC066]|uniref:EpsG family protein n=1 Tax=Polaribacter sp. IC066 TaxID=57032 RepID=UPI0011BE85B4|nr:EpsG family protein [Polaribacter sp. IC066]TXD56690.1 EpsG family protein [Polaribacter sp. IC066]